MQKESKHFLCFRFKMNLSLNAMKKVRRLTRKGKLLLDDPTLDEKQEMISALTAKCNKSPEVKSNVKNTCKQTDISVFFMFFI